MAVLSMLLWATSFPISDVLLKSWDPLSLATIRLTGGALVLGLLAFISGRKYNWQSWPFRDALFVGALGIGVGTFAMNLGLKYSNPVNVTVIATTIPLFSVVMGALKGEEKVTTRISVAIGLAISGGLLVSWSSTRTEIGFEGGEFLVLGAVILWAWFSRVSVTRLLPIPAYPRTLLTMAAGALFLLPVTLLIKHSGFFELSASLSPPDLAQVFALCVFGVGLSMVCWMISAEKIGVTVAALHINALPFYVLLLDLMFGGTLLISQVFGAVLVALGAALSQISWRRTAS